MKHSLANKGVIMKSESVKRIVRNAQSRIDPVIKFYKKSHYGGAPLMYVISSHKDPLNTLTKAKTLTGYHVEALKELGFTFVEGKE